MHARHVRIVPVEDVKKLFDKGIEVFGNLNRLALAVDYKGRPQYYRWYKGFHSMGEPCFLKVKKVIEQAQRASSPSVVLRRSSLAEQTD